MWDKQKNSIDVHNHDMPTLDNVVYGCLMQKHRHKTDWLGKFTVSFSLTHFSRRFSVNDSLIHSVHV